MSLPKEKVIPVVGSIIAIIGAVFAGLAIDILREISAVLVLKYATNLVNQTKALIKAHQEAKAAK